jgi:hypothetical protein
MLSRDSFLHHAPPPLPTPGTPPRLNLLPCLPIRTPPPPPPPLPGQHDAWNAAAGGAAAGAALGVRLGRTRTAVAAAVALAAVAAAVEAGGRRIVADPDRLRARMHAPLPPLAPSSGED